MQPSSTASTAVCPRASVRNAVAVAFVQGCAVQTGRHVTRRTASSSLRLRRWRARICCQVSLRPPPRTHVLTTRSGGTEGVREELRAGAKNTDRSAMATAVREANEQDMRMSYMS